MNYFAIIEQDNGVYGVVFPDFLGCVTVGDTVDEALQNAREALALHAEGMQADDEDLPEPSSIDAIKAGSGEWYTIGADDVIAAVPLIQRVGASVRVNVNIDRGLLQAIDDEAARRGLSRSAFMIGASLEHI